MVADDRDITLYWFLLLILSFLMVISFTGFLIELFGLFS